MRLNRKREGWIPLEKLTNCPECSRPLLPFYDPHPPCGGCGWKPARALIEDVVYGDRKRLREAYAEAGYTGDPLAELDRAEMDEIAELDYYDRNRIRDEARLMILRRNPVMEDEPIGFGEFILETIGVLPAPKTRACLGCGAQWISSKEPEVECPCCWRPTTDRIVKLSEIAL